MTLYHWSQTAANNATADITCPFPEGQAPSSVNDGTRGLMAAVAKFRDDISGQIVTAGTSTAYTLSSFQNFDNATDMDGKTIAFTPHVTNGSSPTLNVDGLGVAALVVSPTNFAPPGTLMQGVVYTATYNHATNQFALHQSVGSSPVPIGAVLEWYDAILPPEGGYCWANGQIIANANTVCPVLLARWGARFGGNGATTMGVPDRREVVGLGVAGMGATGPRGLTSFTGWNVVNTLFGTQNNTLQTANLPPYTPSGSVSGSASVTSAAGNVITGTAVSSNASAGPNLSAISGIGSGAIGSTGSISGSLNGNAQGGTSAPVNNMQPSLTCAYILRLG